MKKWLSTIIFALLIVTSCTHAPEDSSEWLDKVLSSGQGSESSSISLDDAIENYQEQQESKLQTTSSGLKWEILSYGSGAKVTEKDTVIVSYVGFLMNGERFDCAPENYPFEFSLGTSAVIKGWEEGIIGMQVGEIKHLVIPPYLGYGGYQIGHIPPNSELIFYIKLMNIVK